MAVCQNSGVRFALFVLLLLSTACDDVPRTQDATLGPPRPDPVADGADATPDDVQPDLSGDVLFDSSGGIQSDTSRTETDSVPELADTHETAPISGAGTVFVVDYADQADVRVYVADYGYQADCQIWRADYAYQADDESKWFFTGYAYQATRTIYFVDYAYQADLTIFYVDYESQAGCQQ